MPYGSISGEVVAFGAVIEKRVDSRAKISENVGEDVPVRVEEVGSTGLDLGCPIVAESTSEIITPFDHGLLASGKATLSDLKCDDWAVCGGWRVHR